MGNVKGTGMSIERVQNGCKRSWKPALSLSKEPALSLSKGFVTGQQGYGRHK